MTFMKPSRRFTALGSARVADQHERMQLLAGALELADRLGRHRLDRLTRDGLVVGNDDDALAHVGRRAVEGGDRHVGLLGQSHERGLGVAVVGRQYDAVGALGDAVLDLLELPVGILAAVELDNFDAVGLERRRRSPCGRPPKSRSRDPGTRSRPSCLLRPQEPLPLMRPGRPAQLRHRTSEASPSLTSLPLLSPPRGLG